MHLSSRTSSLPFSLLSVFALLDLSFAVNIDCKDVGVKGYHYDLSALKGPHAVHWIREEELVTRNFTFTIDLCSPLKKKKEERDCPVGTYGMFISPWLHVRY
jgi:autophagy-related protein 27